MLSEDAALLAAQRSWQCVMNNDKEGWLALMSDDVCVEDPIGTSITNPTGQGVKGKAAMSEFYDKHISESKISIETHESYFVEGESAHKMTITTTLSNGVISKVTSIFTYHINDTGLITNLRGYWKLADMSFTQPD